MKSNKKRTYLLITIPILALFVCFNTIPLIRGIVYSFTNFKGFGTYDWVGFRNYMDLFTDSRIGGSYLFTFKLAIVATILTNVISLVLALGLNGKSGKELFPCGLLLAKRSGRTGCRLHFPVPVHLHHQRLAR